MLVTRGKQRDIVGSLPLELVLQIVEYLDAVDIVRSQRVSKQWRMILTSDAITKIFLPRTLAALGMEGKNVKAADATTYFQWLHGLQSARPVKKVFLPSSKLGGEVEEVVYDSRRLCYQVRGRSLKEATMLDLETGRRSNWVNEAQHLIQRVILSDRYLAMISRARSSCVLVVWDIHTSQRLAERRVLRVPSRVTIEKDKVIIIPNTVTQSYPIYVWDLCTDQFQTIGSFSDLDLWYVDTDEDVLVTFEIDWKTHLPKVQQTKWSLVSGEQLSRKKFHLSVAGPRVDRRVLQPSFNDWHRTSGHKTVTELYHVESDPLYTLRLTYDYATDCLSLHWIHCAKPINDVALRGRCNSLAPHIIYRWAVQHRGIVIYDVAADTATVHPYQFHAGEVITRQFICALLPPSPHEIRLEPLTNLKFFSTHWFFGDREVFGVGTRDGIQLWFFNPDFVPDLPDAEPFLAMEESG